MRHFLTMLLLFAAGGLVAQQKSISLTECFKIAEKNNVTIQQMQQSVVTRTHQAEASKKSFLPEVDLLGGYTYLSDPIKVNLQTVREGVVNGTSQQTVDAANKVYHEITGNDLSQPAQSSIHESSRNILNEIYPNYNPTLSRQQYFTAGLALKMPVYLGGKLRSASEVADKQVISGNLNLQQAQNIVATAVIAKYLQVLYYNSMISSQEQLLEAFQKTRDDATALVKNEIIPPYQAHWANVALSQAQTGLQTFQLEQENALLELKHLMGTDSTFHLSDTLQAINYFPAPPADGYAENNIGYQWLQAKSDEAEAAVRVSKSLSLPNVFGVANYQFLQKDLPVISPPWMVGLVFQWNIFSGFENSRRVEAMKSLVKESDLLTKQKKEDLQLEVAVAQNKIRAFREQMNTLDEARKEAANTTEMIRRRMANQLSSAKDVNDALKIQMEANKAYYTAVLAYNTAVAAYMNIIGTPMAVAEYLN